MRKFFAEGGASAWGFISRGSIPFFPLPPLPVFFSTPPSKSFFFFGEKARRKRREKRMFFLLFLPNFHLPVFFALFSPLFFCLIPKQPSFGRRPRCARPFFFFLSFFFRILENVACGIFSKAWEKSHLFPFFSKDYFFSQNIFFRFFLHIKSINKEKRNSVPWRSWLAQQFHKLKAPGSTPGGTI